MFRITIDTGTTNTRVVLWKGYDVVDSLSAEVGVRTTVINGHNEELKSTISELITRVLQTNDLNLNSIDLIAASGMITSNVGLVEVPHIPSPAGMESLSKSMVCKRFPEIVDQDIWFVPGVKSISPSSAAKDEVIDIMRGEEVETFALVGKLNVVGPALFILPGSHTKFVFLDSQERITESLTTLTGELLSAVSNHTIIANAVDKSYATTLLPDRVIQGYQHAKQAGLSRAAFSIRVLDQFSELSVNEKANMLMGVIFAEDLRAILHHSAIAASEQIPVYIAGKEIVRDALALLFAFEKYEGDIIPVESQTMNHLAGYGVLRIAENHGLISQ
ncbi:MULTISPECIES: 2-dehydro-3-deoxygalactonokinase [unclassified Paenibacillus]|uniref:2-dehydro-3-deoxygalactonokinase n=1 Tax=unclassified Paenibacillus TaxID=185978 RepID=UPI001AE7EDE6|nr:MULTISPECIES: 2-dehydro-3-deoxygalactonokinase [unclassified Paenibacillus]MBP1153601.1 2-dehydro-3-deoxygalactonokinase [Paenibacillus sp. PvP091]MBP1171014.1 2-dehydro-3-deoxygalactonokinase [Paenibacillus sp. PvR098]MBP2442042.1 2-dehydro-3-deoxygalactonokinase [Paenibacillus sp. PvP052]